MFERVLTVRYITSKNCFCTLSLINFKPLQSKAVTLTYNDKKAYVSVNSTETLDDDSIGVNSLYAKTLGIEDKTLITVSEIVKPPTIQSVTVTAISRNDHDILELLAESVQSTLLEQIRVLNNGQKFVIWIGNSINITVIPFDIKPIAPGSLDFLTEVVIKPPGIKEVKSTGDKKIDIFANYRSSDGLVLRLVPFTKLSEKLGELNQPFNVFVFKSTLSQNLPNTLTNPHIYSVKLLSDDISEEKLTYVRLFVFEDFINNFKLNSVCSENIYVSDTLLDYFNCGIGARALLQLYNGTLPEVDEIEICTKRNYSINAKEVFQQYLADNCKDQPFILNAQIILNFDKNLKCFLRFHPPEAKFCFVNQDFVRNFKLSVSIESLPQKEILEEDQFYADNYTTEVANYQDIVNKSVFLIIHDKKIHCNMYNILITGKTGTGKTTLLKIINSTITSFPYFIYTKQISCKSIKGKTVESLHKLFVGVMFDLIHHQPSVLILDDLHILCENVKENDAFAQNTIYFNRVSEMLEGLFQNFCECNTVGILATANSTTKLNKNIYATRGNHFFKNVYNINPLENIDRRRLLEYFFSDCTYSDSDVAKLAEKSESFVIQDVVDLANKTLFESCQEGYNDDVITITLKHCEKALESVRMASLDGVNLYNAGDKDLDDIGGLNDVKNILIETMLWPSKHPNLFSNAPLRLPSGLLLYGPPGTGKTILAAAAAKHCGLRLISIKGPELLSKYIGASEQAVRDVFQRAQSAKPCVLFFDEFDSLAPRRGHDNTGVTDRVVNQLLTQLDGIESLSGVFVLAATSRPDLLDPALLRPGRLDKHIRCSLPDETSRLEILKVLSKKLHFSSDVDLSEVARLSEGFSGADLQAVLYSAQLESVKHVLEDEENSQELQPEIQHTQLLEALRNTRPSLSNTEQIKYEQIYRNFEGNSGNNFTPGTRATLA